MSGIEGTCSRIKSEFYICIFSEYGNFTKCPLPKDDKSHICFFLGNK